MMITLLMSLIVPIFSIGLFFPMTAQNVACMSFSSSESAPESKHSSYISDPIREAMGTIEPNGAPQKPPIRVEAGESCIVDLTQAYIVTGTLSGSFEINYRIIVHGPCTEPPGTYDEEWIAYGTFIGIVNNLQTEGKFTYIAEVRAGGNIEGKIVFGQGITGELNITGNFNDGKLSYKGSIK